MPLVSFSVSTYDAHDPFGDRGGDPKLEEAATTIGARAIRVFFDRYDAVAGGRLGGGMVWLSPKL
jgi:hypothetical protein